MQVSGLGDRSHQGSNVLHVRNRTKALSGWPKPEISQQYCVHGCGLWPWDRQLNTQTHTLNQNSLGPFQGSFGNSIKQKKHLFDNKTYGPMTYASPEPETLNPRP